MSKRGYLDIHCHIVPGVDDGPSSMAESLNMIEQAYEQGIRVIVATPHFGVINPNYDKAVMMRNLRELIGLSSQKFPDLKIVTGNELYYSPGIIDELMRGNALTLGASSYCLIEFDIEAGGDTITQCIQEFTLAGYRPIIAHAERYFAMQGKWKLAEELASKGAYLQINARSILSKKNSKRKKTAKMLLEHDLVHFIASDAHDDNVRTPIMESAVVELRNIIGDERTDRITRRNIIKLIRNEFI